MMDEFRPPWWLRNRHLQTFLGTRGEADRVSAGTLVHRVPTSDGESLALHEDSPSDPLSSDRPTVLLIHGLAGCHQSGYIVRIGHALFQAGWRVLRLDMRGCGAGEQWAHKPPHAGLTSDVGDTLAYIATRYAPQKLGLVGFSLGGNLVLKFLGELGRGAHRLTSEQIGLKYAISVSPPIELSLAADLMEQGTGKLYTAYFMKLLQQQLRGKLELWEAWREQAARVGIERVLRTIREFDDAYTAPLAGFASAADYYQKSSGRQFLDSIQVRCDLLVAKDDPIVPFASYAGLGVGERWLKNAAGQMVVMPYGGHLGFIERTRPYQRWMDRWVVSRLVQVFQ